MYVGVMTPVSCHAERPLVAQNRRLAKKQTADTVSKKQYRLFCCAPKGAHCYYRKQILLQRRAF